MRTSASARLLPGLVLLAVLVGCRDDSSSTSSSGQGGDSTSSEGEGPATSSGQGGTSGQGGAGQGGAGQGGAGQGGTTSTSSSAQGGGCPEGGAPPGQGAMSCGELGAVDCFTNYDCAAAERCQNVGTADLPVACCVPGERGAGVLGDPCASEADCKSSLCIEVGVCGGTCTDECTDPSVCPPEMPQCIPIAFSGSDMMFCTP